MSNHPQCACSDGSRAGNEVLEPDLPILPDLNNNIGELILDRDDPNRILPTHRLSGLPLIVLPIDTPNPNAEMWVDYDHRNYPRQSWELKGIGGAAVRCSSGQDLPRWLHKRKHNVFPTGPRLPRTNAAKYMSCVLSCAGYIPRQAIDLTPDGTYRIVEMSDSLIEDLARSRTIHLEDANHANTGSFYRNTIGKFFGFYAISQDLSHVSPKVIGEFLDPLTNETRKKELGNLLLAESVDVALQPIRDLQGELKDQGLVRLRRRDPPETVVRKFFVKSRFTDYHLELHNRLEASLAA